MDKPYYVKRIVCPNGADCGDLWLWVVLGPNAPQVICEVHSVKAPADRYAGLLNDAYRHGHHDGVAEHTAILRNATPTDRDEGTAG